MHAFPDKGILAALVIPRDEEGNLKLQSLENHITWLIEKGIHGILVNGSSAGFPLLTVMERKQAMREVTRLAGSLPVIANISDTDPRVVAELGNYAAAIGNCGVAIMPHGFYHSNPDDQLAWFRHAADAAKLPVMLYNFPERTGNRIDTETIRRFSECAPMAGIKQSGGEFAYHEELIALGNEYGFSVFSGSDTRLPEVFQMGAAGCIGGMVNFVPELMVSQFRIFLEGSDGDLEASVERMQRIGDLVARQPFPANVMYGMQARGFDPGFLNLVQSTETMNSLEEMAGDLKRLFREWKLPRGDGE